MQIVKWISDEESSDMEAVIGGLGGWFGPLTDMDILRNGGPHTWQDMLDSYTPEGQVYLEALRDEVLNRRGFITGQQHQDDPEGVPVFEDGKIVSASWRGWGDLMAAIKASDDGQYHCYMEYYM